MIYETIYKKLMKVLGNKIPDGYERISVSGYMDLHIQYLETKDNGGVIISLAHNYEQNGDVMAEPDMKIRIYPETKMAEAMTYQYSYFGQYQQVYPIIDGKEMLDYELKKKLNSVLLKWLTTLNQQGFTKRKQVATKAVI